MKSPPRGEVWLVDLGLAAKVRPCLVLSVPVNDDDRMLVTLVPHTTSVHGSRFEAVVPVPFLKAGAFSPQSLVTVPLARLVRKLGVLRAPQLSAVEEKINLWLGLAGAA